MNYSLSYQNVVKISKCDKLSEFININLLTHGIGFRDAITAKKKIEQLREKKKKGPTKIGG